MSSLIIDDSDKIISALHIGNFGHESLVSATDMIIDRASTIIVVPYIAISIPDTIISGPDSIMDTSDAIISGVETIVSTAEIVFLKGDMIISAFLTSILAAAISISAAEKTARVNLSFGGNELN